MIELRPAEPADYDRVIAEVDRWWGRDVSPMLPRLFFTHFHATSFVAEEGGTLAGFLCGFLSPADADEAYVHFVGVDPAFRGRDVGRRLYDRFFEAIRPRRVVRCLTSPSNEASIAFHTSIGFEVERIARDHDGPGRDRALFVRRL